MYRLVSYPQVSVGDFPLRLPLPNAISSGGFTIDGVSYLYSGLDLLVAGLEADYRGEIVIDLAQYFDSHRTMVSEMWVMLHILSSTDEDRIHSHSVLEWKTIINIHKDSTLLRVLRRNAPLTFKWGITI